ncbi:hypothetical protein [Hymenobacter daecheongensis]|uniref:hypothetical protein n=1 Tax=Hymenobacter daecheongensis TaxID=496053 RepID=UPI0011611C20|nr:hypothetical protein [Hymenobacter daecheongensis]
MNTGLTSTTEQTIIEFAHAFDGYRYAEKVWLGQHPNGAKYLNLLRETGKLPAKAEDGLTVNFLLHRGFHHQGWLPEAQFVDWYDMLYLYLHLYRLPIPSVYRHTALYGKWANRTKGSAEAAAAEIRQLLRRTQTAY